MGTIKVGLETVVSEFPERIVTDKNQAYLYPLLPEEIRGHFHFPKEMRRWKKDDALEILAERVAKKALDRAGLRPSDIDCVMATQFGGLFVWPMVAPYIHHKLGLPQNVPAFNISNACASFLDGCEIAWSLVLSGRYKRILFVTAAAWETAGGQGRADFTDPMSAIFGDGAGAAIISSQNLKCEFLSYYGRTFGDLYDKASCGIRGPANPGLKGAPDQPSVGAYMFGTPYFFDWWKKNGPTFGVDNLKPALEKVYLNLSDLDMIIFHQPVDFLYDMWMDGAEEAGISRDKWKHTYHQYGNMGNCVIPVNLAEFWEKGELKKGSIIGLIAIGAGAHSPSMIIRWLV